MGAAFGYHRGMDTIGAVIGPLIAVVLLELNFSLREILWFAVIPGALTLLLVRRLRRGTRRVAPRSQGTEVTAEKVSALPGSFWTVLAIWVVFSLGNSSDAFLLLRSHNLGLDAVLVVLAYAVYNVVSATLAWPLATSRIGFRGLGARARDSLVRPRLPRLCIRIAAVGGLAVVRVLRRLRRGDRGRRPRLGRRPRALGVGRDAYGVFYAATGGAALIASLAAGVLWTYVSPRAPFVLGVCTAAASTVLLGAYAVSGWFGPRSAKVLLAVIVVELPSLPASSTTSSVCSRATAQSTKVPLVLTRPCVAAPSERVTPNLPPKFPSPTGVVYTGQQRPVPSTPSRASCRRQSSRPTMTTCAKRARAATRSTSMKRS
jgi:hypothetical protein